MDKVSYSFDSWKGKILILKLHITEGIEDIGLFLFYSASQSQHAMVVSWTDLKAFYKTIHERIAVLGGTAWIFYQLEILESSINVLAIYCKFL